ncbi:sensor protein [Halostella sp. JP-L12]|uniref:DICT sensory domain-containing protein n=1 Tax=Halostella TaxID=1843185 RepID=UPI000EF763C1|nr:MULTISPECIES: DICT sensory domain-containing protein [Halostella]NHN47634.1 sensor protein [Halostella sp. JP-L12]
MALADFIEATEAEEQTVVEYSPSPSSELEELFATRNVQVVHRTLPDDGSRGFVVVRRGGDFYGALSLAAIERALAPSVGAPGARAEAAFRDFLDLFDETVFTAYDRRKMLATSREIEDRAWRVGRGALYAGFQSADALQRQARLYGQFGEKEDLDVHVYLADDWESPALDAVTIHAESAAEIGDVWFVVFESPDEMYTCALIAEERSAGEFYGFWTYDPDTVGDVVAYLRGTY